MALLDEYILNHLFVVESDRQILQDDDHTCEQDCEVNERQQWCAVQFQVYALCLSFTLSIMWIRFNKGLKHKIRECLPECLFVSSRMCSHSECYKSDSFEGSLEETLASLQQSLLTEEPSTVRSRCANRAKLSHEAVAKRIFSAGKKRRPRNYNTQKKQNLESDNQLCELVYYDANDSDPLHTNGSSTMICPPATTHDGVENNQDDFSNGDHTSRIDNGLSKPTSKITPGVNTESLNSPDAINNLTDRNIPHHNTIKKLSKAMKSKISKNVYNLIRDESTTQLVDVFGDVQCFSETKNVPKLSHSNSAQYTIQDVFLKKEQLINDDERFVEENLECGDPKQTIVDEQQKAILYNSHLKLKNESNKPDTYSRLNVDEAASDLLVGDLSMIINKYPQKENDTSMNPISNTQTRNLPHTIKRIRHAKFKTQKPLERKAKEKSLTSNSGNITGNKSSKRLNICRFQDEKETESCDIATAAIARVAAPKTGRQEEHLISSTSSWSTSLTVPGPQNANYQNGDKYVKTNTLKTNIPNEGSCRMNNVERNTSNVPNPREKQNVISGGPILVNRKRSHPSNPEYILSKGNIMEHPYSGNLGKSPKYDERHRKMSPAQQISSVERAMDQYLYENLRELASSAGSLSTKHRDEARQILTYLLSHSKEVLAEVKGLYNSTHREPTECPSAVHGMPCTEKCRLSKNCFKNSASESLQDEKRKYAPPEGKQIETERPTVSRSPTTISSSKKTPYSNTNDHQDLYQNTTKSNRKFLVPSEQDVRSQEINTMICKRLQDCHDRPQLLKQVQEMTHNVDLVKNLQRGNWSNRKYERGSLTRGYLHSNGRQEEVTKVKMMTGQRYHDQSKQNTISHTDSSSYISTKMEPEITLRCCTSDAKNRTVGQNTLHILNSIVEETEQVENPYYNTAKTLRSDELGESMHNDRGRKSEFGHSKQIYGEYCNLFGHKMLTVENLTDQEAISHDPILRPSNTVDRNISQIKQKNACKPNELEIKYENKDDFGVKSEHRCLHDPKSEQSHILKTEVALRRKSLIPRHFMSTRKNAPGLGERKDNSQARVLNTKHNQRHRVKTDSNQPDLGIASSIGTERDKSNFPISEAGHFSLGDKMHLRDNCIGFAIDKLHRKTNNKYVNNQKQTDLQTLNNNIHFGQKKTADTPEEQTFVNDLRFLQGPCNTLKSQKIYTPEFNTQSTHRTGMDKRGRPMSSLTLASRNLGHKLYSVSNDLKTCTSPYQSTHHAPGMTSKIATTHDAIKMRTLANGGNAEALGQNGGNRMLFPEIGQRIPEVVNETRTCNHSCMEMDTTLEDSRYNESQRVSSASDDISLLALTTLNQRLMSSSPITAIESHTHSQDDVTGEMETSEHRPNHQQEKMPKDKVFLRDRFNKTIESLDSKMGSHYCNASKAHCPPNVQATNNKIAKDNKSTTVDNLASNILPPKCAQQSNNDGEFLNNISKCLENGTRLHEINRKLLGHDLNKSSNTHDDTFTKSSRNGSKFHCTEYGSDYVRASVSSFQKNRPGAMFGHARGGGMVASDSRNKILQTSSDHAPEIKNSDVFKSHLSLIKHDNLVQINEKYQDTERKDSHNERKDSHNERKDSHNERKDSHNERKDSHNERKESHNERKDSHNERKDSHNERKDSHNERKDSHNERKDSHNERMYEKRAHSEETQTGDRMNNKRATVCKTAKPVETKVISRTGKRPKLSLHNQQYMQKTWQMKRNELDVPTKKQQIAQSNTTGDKQAQSTDVEQKGHTSKQPDNKEVIVTQKTDTTNQIVFYGNQKKDENAKLSDEKEDKDPTNMPAKGTNITSHISSRLTLDNRHQTTSFTNENLMSLLARQSNLPTNKPVVNYNEGNTNIQCLKNIKVNNIKSDMRNEHWKIAHKRGFNNVTISKPTLPVNKTTELNKKGPGNNRRTATIRNKINASNKEDEKPLPNIEDVGDCNAVDTHREVSTSEERLKHESQLFVSNISPIRSDLIKSQPQISSCRNHKKNLSSLCSKGSICSRKSKNKSICSNSSPKRCYSQSITNEDSIKYHFAEIECPGEATCRRTKLVRLLKDDMSFSEPIKKSNTANVEAQNKTKETIFNQTRDVNSKELLSESSIVALKHKTMAQTDSSKVNSMSSEGNIRGANIGHHCVPYKRSHRNEEYAISGCTSKCTENDSNNRTKTSSRCEHIYNEQKRNNKYCSLRRKNYHENLAKVSNNPSRPSSKSTILSRLHSGLQLSVKSSMASIDNITSQTVTGNVVALDKYKQYNNKSLNSYQSSLLSENSNYVQQRCVDNILSLNGFSSYKNFDYANQRFSGGKSRGHESQNIFSASSEMFKLQKPYSPSYIIDQKTKFPKSRPDRYINQRPLTAKRNISQSTDSHTKEDTISLGMRSRRTARKSILDKCRFSRNTLDKIRTPSSQNMFLSKPYFGTTFKRDTKQQDQYLRNSQRNEDKYINNFDSNQGRTLSNLCLSPISNLSSSISLHSSLTETLSISALHQSNHRDIDQSEQSRVQLQTKSFSSWNNHIKNKQNKESNLFNEDTYTRNADSTKQHTMKNLVPTFNPSQLLSSTSSEQCSNEYEKETLSSETFLRNSVNKTKQRKADINNAFKNIQNNNTILNLESTDASKISFRTIRELKVNQTQRLSPKLDKNCEKQHITEQRNSKFPTKRYMYGCKRKARKRFAKQDQISNKHSAGHSVISSPKTESSNMSLSLTFSDCSQSELTLLPESSKEQDRRFNSHVLNKIPIGRNTTNWNNNINDTLNVRTLNKLPFAQAVKKTDWKQRFFGCPLYMNPNNTLLVPVCASRKNRGKKSYLENQSNNRPLKKCDIKHRSRVLRNIHWKGVRDMTKNNNENTMQCTHENQNESYLSRHCSTLETHSSVHSSTSKSYLQNNSYSTRWPCIKTVQEQEVVPDNKDVDTDRININEGDTNCDLSNTSNLKWDWYKSLKSSNLMFLPTKNQQEYVTAYPCNVSNHQEGTINIRHRTGSRAYKQSAIHNNDNFVSMNTFQNDHNSKLASWLVPQSSTDKAVMIYTFPNVCSSLVPGISADFLCDEESNRPLNERLTMETKPRKQNKSGNGEEEEQAVNCTTNEYDGYFDVPWLNSEQSNVSVTIDNYESQTDETPRVSSHTMSSSHLICGFNMPESSGESGGPNGQSLSTNSSPYISLQGNRSSYSSPVIRRPTVARTVPGGILVRDLYQNIGTGFSYLYRAASDFDVSRGHSKSYSQLRDRNSRILRMRTPNENTFVGKVVNIFERKLKKVDPQ